MNKTICVTLASVVVLVIVVGALSTVAIAASASSPPTDRPSPASVSDANSAPNEKTALEQPEAVARVGDYTITKDELKQRLLREIRPEGDGDIGPKQPVTAQSVLLDMIADKAMMMEGRKLGYLQDELISSSIKKYKQRKLINAFLTDYVEERVSVEPPEVDKAMKANAKLTREQAEATVRRAKASQLLGQFYNQLVEKSNVKRLKENFKRASQIHQRLLYRPATPRKESWIKNSQIRDELSDEEKGIVLARYDGGAVTLEDWFKALGDIVPPRRPRDLNQPQGVEKLLNRALQPKLLATEARARGYEKNAKLLEEIREREDQSLLGKVRSEKVKDLGDPTPEQIKAYFEKNQERFADSAWLNVDQIWCDDLAIAGKVKDQLADGADFESVKNTFSVSQDSKPHKVYPSGEGLFWDELWKVAEPNEVIGPMKGFYDAEVKWRVLRVLEKQPAKMKPYSDELGNRVKWAIQAERRRDILDRYKKELRAKDAYEIQSERIEDIDPLAVGMETTTPR